jgi:uncharacterized OB-fold protein
MAAEFPLPDTEWEVTREFWAAAERGELVIPRCDACGTYNWYPESRCKSCDSEKLVWTPVSGRGRLFSWAVVRHAFLKEFAEKVPYVTGLVALDEDPSIRLATNLIDCEAEKLKIDMPVRVVFRPLAFSGISREVIAPMFAPVEEPDV